MNYRIKVDDFILKLFFFTVPIFDNLTGFFIKLGIMSEASLASPSQLIKFLLWGLFLIRVVKFSSKKTVYFVIFFLILFVLYETFISIFFNTTMYAWLYGILNVFKLSYIFLFYLYIKELLEFKIIDVKRIKYFFLQNGFLCVTLIFLTTILKLNYNTYDEGTIGTKGLFPSGNGISLYLGAISFLSVIELKKEHNIKKIIFSLYLVIGSSIIGTKASIIFLLINMYYIVFKIIRHGKLLVLAFFVFCGIRYISVLEKIFDVIIFRYKNSSSLFAFLASGRDNYIRGAFSEFYSNGLYSLRLFFGLGAFLSFRMPYEYNLVVDTLENDFFDVFFMYGLNGLFLYISVILFFIKNCIKYHNRDVLILGITVFFYSVWAGHMLFNATSGILIALVIVLSLCREDCIRI